MARTLTDDDLAAIGAVVKFQNEDYGRRLWALDTGTGKRQVIDVLADHTNRLQRIEATQVDVGICMRIQDMRSPLRPPVWFGLATVTGQQEGTWSHLHEFAIFFAQMGGSQMRL